MPLIFGLAVIEVASEMLCDVAEEACLKAYRMGYDKGRWSF